MKCPFLEETQVKYCRHSAVRKMIVRTLSCVPDEKCSSSRYGECELYRQHAGEAGTPTATCPFLEDAWMQYCSAASVPRFIPYSEALLSRCAGAGYRYCDAYLALAQPPEPGTESDGSDGEGQSGVEYAQADGVSTPRRLFYSPNHLWLDRGEGGLCHVGVDAFLARVFGRIEHITFLSMKGLGRPAAVLTLESADLMVTFPNSLLHCEPNLHLRADPSKVASDPYRLGWLFKGYDPEQKGAPGGSATEGLLPGAEAVAWMRAEVEALSRFAHEMIENQAAPALATDGGEFAGGIIQHFTRDQTLSLFNEFFSPYRSWTRQS